MKNRGAHRQPPTTVPSPTSLDPHHKDPEPSAANAKRGVRRYEGNYNEAAVTQREVLLSAAGTPDDVEGLTASLLLKTHLEIRGAEQINTAAAAATLIRGPEGEFSWSGVAANVTTSVNLEVDEATRLI